jgi:hypothetical protein
MVQQSRKIYKQDLTLEVGYVMTNEHIPNLIKIGMTTRTPNERSSELSSTGLPGRWSVEYSIFVPNCEKIEKKFIRHLTNLDYLKIESSSRLKFIRLSKLFNRMRKL